MTSTEVLKHEHKIVLLVLAAAEREAKSIKATGKIDVEKLDKMIDFFRNFTDRCHHAKEEKHLFVRMGERGVAGDRGPIAVMLREHQEGRQKVKAIAEALPQVAKGKSSAVTLVKENLLAYIDLLKAHINKEDNILYPLGDKVLTAEDQRALIKAFEEVEADEMGEGVHKKYHELAHELAKG